MSESASSRGDLNRLRWRAAWIVLTALFALAAALNLLHVRGGFLTNHLADAVVPPWLYIAMRGLAGHRRQGLLARTFGATPGVAAGTVFAGSAITELAQRSWPHGLFPGTYDPLDIAAYAAGTGACLIADILTREAPAGISARPQASSPGEVDS